jgi:hypothetical protein
MRPIAFVEALPAGTRLTLFSDDKPDRFFTVIKFWLDATSGVALDLKTGVPTYQVEEGLPRRRLPEAGGRQNSFTASRADRRRGCRPMLVLFLDQHTLKDRPEIKSLRDRAAKDTIEETMALKFD